MMKCVRHKGYTPHNSQPTDRSYSKLSVHYENHIDPLDDSFLSANSWTSRSVSSSCKVTGTIHNAWKDLPWKDPIANKHLHLFIQLMLLSKTGNITSNCQVNNCHISQRQVHSLNYNNVNRSNMNNTVFKLTSKQNNLARHVGLKSHVSFLVLNL